MLVMLGEENFLKIVKETRKLILSQHTEPECKDSNTLFGAAYIEDNINALEKKLEPKTSSIPNNNVSYATLEVAAKMFTYLNYCPPKYLYFVKNLIETRSPNEIIFGLISAKMTLHNLKQSSVKVLIKVMETLGLKQYENIQIITKGRCYDQNAIFSKCEKKINFSDKDTPGI